MLGEDSANTGYDPSNPDFTYNHHLMHQDGKFLILTNYFGGGVRQLEIGIQGRMAIGPGGLQPEGALDIQLTNGAFIPPRLTNDQRNSITGTSPAGSVIFNKDTNQLEILQNKQISGYEWAAPGAVTRCDSGYTLIGTAGSKEAFCISYNEEPSTVSYEVAVVNCYNSDAHLCRYDEWLTACIASSAGSPTPMPGAILSNMKGNWEWFFGINGSTGGFGAVGNSSCFTTDSSPTVSSAKYRCCKK